MTTATMENKGNSKVSKVALALSLS